MLHRPLLLTSTIFRKSLISSDLSVHFVKKNNFLFNYYDISKFSSSSQVSPMENLERVQFDEFKKLIRDEKVFVIDVREPAELVQDGALPRSINVPLKEVENAFQNLSDEQFLSKYGHKKPSKDSPIVFSCLKGLRSEKAQITALKLQFKDVKNYFGGWAEWAEKNKQ